MHGFQLLDIWIHHSAWNSENCERSKLFDTSAAGSSPNLHFFSHIANGIFGCSYVM